MYELHRRLSSIAVPDDKLWHTPWLELHPSIQGILYHMWPPHKRGANWQIPPWDFEGPASREEEQKEFLKELSSSWVFSGEEDISLLYPGRVSPDKGTGFRKGHSIAEENLVRFGPVRLSVKAAMAAVLQAKKIASKNLFAVHKALSKLPDQPFRYSKKQQELLKSEYNNVILRVNRSTSTRKGLSKRWELLQALDKFNMGVELNRAWSKGDRALLDRFFNDHQEGCKAIGIQAFNQSLYDILRNGRE